MRDFDDISQDYANIKQVLMALGKYQVPYNDHKFCWSAGPGFASSGISR